MLVCWRADFSPSTCKNPSIRQSRRQGHFLQSKLDNTSTSFCRWSRDRLTRKNCKEADATFVRAKTTWSLTQAGDQNGQLCCRAALGVGSDLLDVPFGPPKPWHNRPLIGQGPRVPDSHLPDAKLPDFP